MKLGFVFPGQGTQYIGMGRRLYDNYAVAKEVFEEANDVLGFDLAKLCFEGSQEELTRTDNAQPAILASSIAAFKVFSSEFEDIPIISAGHSLGEFSALTSSGAISYSDALRLVRKRGQLMNEYSIGGQGTMSAIKGLSKEIIEDECKKISENLDQIVMISNYNSSNQISISGHKNAVEYANERFEKLGAEVTALNVSAAFHSSLMNDVAVKFKEELLKYTYHKPQWDVLSNVTAESHDSANITTLLAQQIEKPVQWEQIMKCFRDKGVEMCIEFGPKSVIRNLFRKDYPEIKAFSFDKPDDADEVREILTPLQSKNKFHHTVVTKCLAIAVCTKNNNWNNDEYESGVVKPYKRIQQIQDKIENDNLIPTKEQMIEALDMLKSVFETKKTPEDEQKERFEQIFRETGTEDVFSNSKYI